MQQVIVDFGVVQWLGARLPLRIYGYGLMMVLGFLGGIMLAQWRARRLGESPDHVGHCGILAVIGGIVGSRVAYLIEHPIKSVDEVVDITCSGLIYYGGFALATVMVVVYLRVKRLPLRRYLDILAASLMLGLAFGRAGCLLNGCCYGARCREGWPLGMRFPMFSKPLIKLDGRDNPFSLGTTPGFVYAHQVARGEIQPDPSLMREGRLIPPEEYTTAQQVALAEAGWSRPVKPAQVLGIVNALLLAALLSAFFRLRSREGQVFALMLLLYPITRFVLEMIRDQRPERHALTHNQYTSLAMFAVGVIMWLTLSRLSPSAGPWWARRLAGARAGPAQPVGAAASASRRKRRHRNR